MSQCCRTNRKYGCTGGLCFVVYTEDSVFIHKKSSVLLRCEVGERCPVLRWGRTYLERNRRIPTLSPLPSWMGLQQLSSKQPLQYVVFVPTSPLLVSPLNPSSCLRWFPDPIPNLPRSLSGTRRDIIRTHCEALARTGRHRV